MNEQIKDLQKLIENATYAERKRCSDLVWKAYKNTNDEVLLVVYQAIMQGRRVSEFTGKEKAV